MIQEIVLREKNHNTMKLLNIKINEANDKILALESSQNYMKYTFLFFCNKI